MSEVKMFDHVLKINGQLIECNANTLKQLTTSSKTLTVGSSDSSKKSSNGFFVDGTFSSGGIRGFKKAGGNVKKLTAFIKKKNKAGQSATDTIAEIEKKFGAGMSKSVIYKMKPIARRR
jgi:hypothetical protein